MSCKRELKTRRLSDYEWQIYWFRLPQSQPKQDKMFGVDAALKVSIDSKQ